MNYGELTRLMGIALLLAGLFFSSYSTASENSAFFDLFDLNDEPLSITLTGPWSELAKDRSANPKYRKATLTSADDAALNIRVKPRGKSRRKKEFCDFPPLRLNFSKKTTLGTRFENQDKLKLVTHCGRLGSSSARFSDQLHSEYLLYRIFNTLTNRSFRVQILDVTWVDTKSNASYSHPAFLIEHKSALIERIGATEYEEPRVSVSELDADYSALAALFAYFAGNTDFSFTRGVTADSCCHNSVAVVAADAAEPAENSGAGILGIPYDFDSTGFVAPNYAAPVEGLGIKMVSQRLHRGYCAHKQAVPGAIDRFLSAKASITETLQTYPGISDGRRKKLLRYTDAFYRVLASDKQQQRNLLKRCR